LSITVVDGAVEIRRSSEDVFDYVTDISREFEWNPRTKRVVKLTEGPIGVGTRWKGEWVEGDPMLIDYIAFDRPVGWRSVGRSRGLLVASDGRVELTQNGDRLTLRVELEPRGRLRLIAPLLSRIMRRRERRNLASIKKRLECGAARADGGGKR
jgi:Polyketide cyclase / dehydrase and lipid transport